MKKRSVFGTFGLLLLASCSSGGERDQEELGRLQQRLFANGDFEDGTHGVAPPNWTVTSYLNPSTNTNPTTVADLNLNPGGTPDTITLVTANGPESEPDETLGAGASLRWPKYGNKVAVVNRLASGYNVNSLKQTMTITTSDIDPADGRAHVRFTVAPVLENPSHPAEEQPYYFVQLRNITKGTVLYQDFNASAQPGVPWKTVGTRYYTDWQLVDIAPGDAGMGVGDQVELEVIAARCAQSGHFGRVYVDGVGATIPGLFVSATGPSGANAGDNVTYHLSYSNGGTGSAGGTVVNFNLPANTTWVGLDAPGLSCTTPAVGGIGQVSCTVGTLAPGGSGNFTATVQINPAATGTITAGNYEILATNSTALLGPKVYTEVTSGVAYADLGITKTNNVGGVAWGQAVTYDIVATNYGPSAVVDAPVQDLMPAELENVSWSCAASGTGSCASPSGSGDIATTVSLPVGGTATFQVTGNVVAGSGSGSLSNTATISAPAGLTDTNPSNDSGVDTDMIGTLRTMTVSKYGGAGTVVSTPSAINCGPSCTSVDGSFVEGMTVTLNAVPAAGAEFEGWGGACSGTSTSCTLTVSGDQWVAAIFSTVPRADGESCSEADQCTSGFCADGVCCDSACGDSVSDCQSCAVAGSAGTCTVLTAGTQCAAAGCTDGMLTPAAQCDGSSTECTVGSTVSCDGLACDAGGSECKTTCADNVDCVSGHYCDVGSGSCNELVDQGGACSGDVQCASGSCVDGVCCNTACDGQCEACNLVAAPGVCLPVSGAPVGGRAACDTDGSLCGGSCDGTLRTACVYPTGATECGEPSCTDGVATLAALCDGSGNCAAPATQPCGEFVCGATACLGDCSVDANCATGYFCSAGICEEQLDAGDSCSRDAQCGSDHCVDGVCCDVACDGQCEACDVEGSVGTCSPVSGQPHGARPACASDGSLCGGSCDGTLTTACAYPTVECRGASCDAGTATLAASCDGAGACPAEQTQDCGSFICGATACLGDCTVDAECSDGSYCSAGVCTPQLDPGAACSAENQCASGNCVDGVCCDAACTGQCEACDVAGAEGTCSPVTGAPHGARTACASDESVCGGSCDGVERESCSYPDAAVECRGAACSDGVATLAAVCDGQGACPELMEQDCGTFLCGATACIGDCTRTADCAGGSYCSAGVCVPERENGDTCSADAQCDSGHCVDGVCCNTACTEQCGACDLDGTEGTCSPVTGAPRNGRATCLGEGACKGLCDGETLDECVFPGEDVTCSEGSCAEGFETSSARCDGGGLCSQPTTESCGPYACAGDVCASTCERAADCASGMYCVDGACQADPPEDVVASPPGTLEGGGFGCSTSPGGRPAGGLPFDWMLGAALLGGVSLLRRRRGIEAA